MYYVIKILGFLTPHPSPFVITLSTERNQKLPFSDFWFQNLCHWDRMPQQKYPKLMKYSWLRYQLDHQTQSPRYWPTHIFSEQLARIHHLSTWPQVVDDIWSCGYVNWKAQFRFLTRKSTSKYDLQKILSIESEGKSDKEVLWYFFTKIWTDL